MSSQIGKEYLETKLRGVIEPMVAQIIVDQPKEPILYMIEWLNQLKGNNISEHNSEKLELRNLRKELVKYKKRYFDGDDEMIVKSEGSVSDEENDKINSQNYRESPKITINKIKRASVSAEVYGIFNKKEAFVPRIILKSESQIQRIKEKILNCFIFNSLDDKELNTVIDAMEEKKFNAGDSIIIQGESGDVLYVVDSGELHCFKKFNKDDDELKVKEYFPGDSFGELALLYNAPRQASIKAFTDSILWALDRETFNNIVKEAAIKKREKYESVLKTVGIFSTIDAYELSQIADALRVVSFSKGDYIIRQSEKGDNFYIILEGEAFAAKIFEEGGKEENVMDYQKGGYFGELALIKNDSRAASVIAKTDCTLLSLDRLSFKRLLGPIEYILKRNSELYVKYIGSKSP